MFNWFRRQFNEQSNQEDKSQEQASETKDAQESTPEPEEVSEASTSTADQLSWAKAAYQNIQARKKQTETSSTEKVAEEKKVESAISEVEEQPEAEEKGTQEAIETPVLETPEVAAIATEAETQPSPTEEPVISPSTPAWMRKSDALERLKETAFDLPEEAPKKAKSSETPVTDVSLDDNFIWSANVLAAQGRRPEDVSEDEINWLSKLREGLGKTRRSLINQLKAVVGVGPLNEDAVMAIEAMLLQADVGIEATEHIIETLQKKLKEESLPPEGAIAYLKTILQEILDKPLQGMENADFFPEKDTLNIWLLTGVNGAGKTTTIGKLANLAQKSGYQCAIAAADTFRAAAVEQVKVWGERTNTPVIANPGKNTDPAAVVFDAINAAISRQADLLLVDTAGRLQNKKNLMAELAKIRSIIDKKAAHAKVESLLVLDATLGQNGLRQAQVFSEAAKLSGVVLTKLDGTAKGGVALAVAQQLNLPIRFIGAGEGIEDLRPFSSYEFVEALLSG
jgi:fused signal recognition particle receptor